MQVQTRSFSSDPIRKSVSMCKIMGILLDGLKDYSTIIYHLTLVIYQ